MIGPANRRAALGAILAAPLASVPALAANPASPELLRLIAKHDRINAILDVEDRDAQPGEGRAAACARFQVQAFASRGLPDILAKAECLARLMPLSDWQDELAREMAEASSWATIDSMTLALALELMRYGRGTLCA